MAKVELVLLDDCLAAVDVHVARAICEEALLGILLDGERTPMPRMFSRESGIQAGFSRLPVFMDP